MSRLLVLHEKGLTCITYLQNREISGLASVNLILTCLLSSWLSIENLGPDCIAVICFCSLVCVRAMKADRTFTTSRHIALSVTSTHCKIFHSLFFFFLYLEKLSIIKFFQRLLSRPKQAYLHPFISIPVLTYCHMTSIENL